MPVTSRSLLVHKVSGAGKKAPINLGYDPLKKQVINITCDCLIPPTTISIKPDPILEPVPIPKPARIPKPVAVPKPAPISKTASLTKTYSISNKKIGNAICDGSVCHLSEYNYITGPQFNAIPGTKFTLTNFEGIIFIVNPTKDIVYCDDEIGFPFLIDTMSVHVTVVKVGKHGLTYRFGS